MPDEVARDQAARAAREANRARFARVVARPDRDLELARGALLIAAADRLVDVDAYLATLDDIAARVRVRLDRGDDARRTLDVLHDTLYRELGFRGVARAERVRPAHSWLDRILDRRVGLPIGLAIVELEVADRIGIELWGVGLPGHFIVGGPGGLLIDPVAGGRSLTRDDCQALIRRSIGDRVVLHGGMLRRVGKREILARVLRNLRAVQLARRDWPAALSAVEYLAVIEPTRPEHRRDRGLLLGRVGQFTPAVAELRGYLAEQPDAADASDVRQVVGIFGGRRN